MGEIRDTFTVLKHYRHDLLNELQLVQGYLQIGSPEKAEKKLAAIFASLHEERKLMQLDVPDFCLWVIQFNHIYTRFRLTYEIEVEEKISPFNDELVNTCKKIINEADSLCEKDELYYIHIKLSKIENVSKIKVQLHVFGLDNFIKNEENTDMERVEIKVLSDQVVFTFYLQL